MAVKNFNAHINLNKQELLKAKLENLIVAPILGESDQGYIYWKKTEGIVQGVPRVWTGTQWLDLGSVYQHPTFITGNLPSSPMTGAVVPSGFTLDNGHITEVKTRNLTAENIGAASSVHTHVFSQVVGLPANTVLGNNTSATGSAKALTVEDLLAMLAIGYGNLAMLMAGTDTNQRTWTAKDISDFVNSKISEYVTVVDLALGVRNSTTLPILNSAGTGVVIPSATTTLAGLLTAADKVKLDSIANNANYYVHPTNNPGAHPFSTIITEGVQVLSRIVVNEQGHVVAINGRDLTAADLASVLINDSINNGVNTTWSSVQIYNEIQDAISQIQTGALQYKGNYNPATNTPSLTTDSNVLLGYTYVISNSGTFLGTPVVPGDMIISKVNSPLANPNNWQVVSKEIPAIVSASTTVQGIVRLATIAETSEGTSQTIAVTPAGLKAVLDTRLKGYVANFGDGTSTIYNITHGLNTTDIHVMIQVLDDKSYIDCEIKAVTPTIVSVSLNIPPTTNAYRILIKPV